MYPKIISLLLIIYKVNLIFNQKCGTDLLIKNYTFINLDNIKIQKRKLNDEYTPLKLKVDMSYLFTQKMFGDETIKRLEKIFNELTNSFSSILSVRHVEVKIDDDNIIKDLCQIPTFHQNVKYWFKEYDIISHFL